MTTGAYANRQHTALGDTLVELRNLEVHFPVTTGLMLKRTVGEVRAVDGVTLSITKGETLGLVGESGCGKTTLGRAALMLHRPTSGQIIFEGQDLTKLTEQALRKARRRMQMIFQDPFSSLNPRMTVGNIIAEPTMIQGAKKRKERELWVKDLMGTVGLNPHFVDRYPHEFSSGQRQRIGIARALSVEPIFIVADEPVSALDVSIQAQIINLLGELQERFNLTFLFIAHDLSVVHHKSDRVAVMYLGKLMEITDSKELYANPLHPYTKALISAVPIPDPTVEKRREAPVLSGDMPSRKHPPPGCPFNTRCPVASREHGCFDLLPEWRRVDAGDSPHWVACHRV